MRIAVPLELDARALAGLDRLASVRDLAGETMGTIWRVRLAAPIGCDLAVLQARIAMRLAAIVAEMSHWEPDSVLSRFNRSDAGEWTALPADFATVMTCGLDIARRSGDAFDPTIGRVVDLWGHGPTRATASPDNAALDSALQESGWRRLAFAAETGRIRQPGGMALDLSGIAKGYAVDVIADVLADAGIGHCLVEIGGELVGRGFRPDGDPWWVDLETPPDITLPPLRVALHQMAVATSGDYVRGPHTIDPINGRPTTSGTTSVSVLHQSAMQADAWASALTVPAAEIAMQLAEKEALAARIITRTGAGPVEWISPMLAQML